MSFPNYPNPARRARLLQAHDLRCQGLTLRQIAQRMDCAHSTVAGYLRDFELFRADLIHELAADQIVSHLLRLQELDAEQHDRRLATVRELRLLLSAIPEIRRDESIRTQELTRGGVAVDSYGNRYPVPNRRFAPTAAEHERSQQPPAHTPAGRPDPDVPLAFLPEPTRTEPNSAEPDTTPELDPPSAVEPVTRGQPAPDHEPSRTESNKTEQENPENPAQDGKSGEPDQHPLDPSIQQAIDEIDRQLRQVLAPRDWLNDYPSHNPNHPQRQRALRLVKQKQALLAQAAAEKEAPDAA